MVDKKSFKWSNIALFSILILFLGALVFASEFTVKSVSGGNFSLNEDNYTIFNFTINYTMDSKFNNISTINISFPSAFTLNTTLGASGPNCSMPINFTSSGNIISFTNRTGVRGDLLNGTGVNNTFCWIWSNVATPGNYSITISAYNLTTLVNSTTINVYVNDSSYPTAISPLTGTDHIISQGNYSGTKIFNITITEDLPSYVLFNVTNSTGQQNVTFVASRQGTTSYYNASLNTVTLPDGTYTMIVQVNDTNMNATSTKDISLSNNSYNYTFTVDNTNPVVTLAQTAATTTTTQMALAITITDATSGIGSSCSSSTRTQATISGTTTSQTLTETALECGTSYSYTITCSDRAGKTGTATQSFSTDACGTTSSGGSSGGSSTTTWTQTVSVTDEQFNTGYNKELSAKNRMKIKVGEEYHYVGVTSLTSTQANIQISSDPVNVQLAIGGDTKVDLDSNGYYDIYVKLNSITNNKADVFVQKINEQIPIQETSDEVELSPQNETPLEEAQNKEKSLLWIWIVIGIVIVIILAIAIKRRR